MGCLWVGGWWFQKSWDFLQISKIFKNHKISKFFAKIMKILKIHKIQDFMNS